MVLGDLSTRVVEPNRSLQQSSGLEDAVLRNIQAVVELSDLIRTSFGPNGAIL